MKPWAGVSGGGGGDSKDFLTQKPWGIILLDKTMIFKGVTPTMQILGVGYASSPQKGDMWRFPISEGLRGFDTRQLLCNTVFLDNGTLV